MSDRQKFEYLDDVESTWEIIDRLSRMVWERDQLSQETKTRVHKAACDFHTELRMASHSLPRREREQRSAPPRGANVDEGTGGNGWRPFTVDKLAELIISKDVGSVAEAFLKATPVLDKMRQTVANSNAGFLFRGQRNIEWPLIPTLGRDVKFQDYVADVGEQEFLKDQYTNTSNYEHNLLHLFKEEWTNLDDVDPLDNLIEVTSDDLSWWFRMQHYGGHEFGTRLLDVTSSIPAALLFACLDWESGHIDDSTDGIIYLFVEGMNSNRVDLTKCPQSFTNKDLFNGFAEAPVFFLNPPHNERSKAQAGAFLWWPKFWEGFPGQILYLRILKERKREIVQDLLLLNFGPKDVVRGQKGQENEDYLRNSLGL